MKRPGWDEYIITVHLLGKKVGKVTIDGLELEVAGYGN